MRGFAFEVAPFAFRDTGDRGEHCEFEALQLEAPPGMPTLRLGSRGAAVAELQRRLAALGLSAGAADGIFGSRTDAAVRSFQRARGLAADGIVGAQTWSQLLGPTTSPSPPPSPPPATGSPGQALVTVPSGVRISDNAVRVLKDILRAAGLTRATVTSGRRTPYDQARIMYELIERHGVSYAKQLYGSSGDQVIDVYAAAKAAGKSATDIKGAMEAKVNQLGCHNVSHHCSDSFDVFDVAPSTISNSTAFRHALDAAVASGAIKMYLSPPEDPAFHIEIALAPDVGELEAFGEFEVDDEFRPASLPKPVREAMGMGALAWPLAVQRAIASGLRKLDELTNIVFFMHHPERMVAGIGRALDSGERHFAALSNEWKAFRTLVRPLLGPSAPAPRAPSPVAPGTPSTTALRYGVPGGVIGSPFDNRRQGAYTGFHLGIDVSTSKASARGADDPRRGLPVFFTPRLTITRSELDTARKAHDRKGPIVAGLGLPAGGAAAFESAQVMQTSHHTVKDHGYGSSVRVACIYAYRRGDGTTQRFVLQIEYLHLITTHTMPVFRKDGSVVSMADWVAAGKAGRIGFGPRMFRGSMFTRAELATAKAPPLVGYLGATVWPHVHIQVALALGSSNVYVRRPRVDPAVAIH